MDKKLSCYFRKIFKKENFKFGANNNPKGFTLVELLVVMGIIAILSSAAVLVINPVEYFRQGRDSRRMSDLGLINSVLTKYKFGEIRMSSLGSVDTVYISIPDSDSACANLNLPPLSEGKSYHCVATTTLQNIDGTGWIPVDFTETYLGASFSNLPIDSLNATSSNYYSYTPSSDKWAIWSGLESQKYQYLSQRDGGVSTNLYEVGPDLSLVSTSALSVISILPYSVLNTEPASISSISGTGFNLFLPLTVRIIGETATITGSGFEITDDTTIAGGIFEVTGSPTGAYDVEITNGNITATLKDGFNIYEEGEM